MRGEVDNDDDGAVAERSVVGVSRKMSPRISAVSSPRLSNDGPNELVAGRTEVEPDTAMA